MTIRLPKKTILDKILKLFVLWCIALFCFHANVSKADQVSVADFSKSNLKGWKDKVFVNKTSYQLVKLNDKTVLKAESQNSASGLIKKIHVDLKNYPFLNWSWRIENRLDTKNEKIKSDDDYATRIYVLIDGGILLWRTKAINYVWTNNAPKNETWPNAFAGKKSTMMALRDSDDKLSYWYYEKRNVYEDLKNIFGNEFESIDAIALMTDTDNSHGQVKSYYGDIFFSSE